MQRKRGKKRILFFLIFFLTGSIWLAHIRLLNEKLLKSNPVVVEKKYETIGEWVPFGDNYYGKNYLYGYSLRVKSTKTYEPEEYREKIMDKSSSTHPAYTEVIKHAYKIYEVEVEVKNENNTGEGLRILALNLVGRDFVGTINTKHFMDVNGYDSDTIGIQITPGTQTTVYLPFVILDSNYREKFTRKLKTEPMWIMLTAYPERRMARVQ